MKSRTCSRDCDTERTAGTHEDKKEYSRSADRPKAQVNTSIVQRIKSKFEAKQRGSQVPTVQRVQKTVEVLRVQYIDKVVDIPVEAAEERADASPRTCWNSGPQRKIRRNQGGNCGQKTGQD